MIQFDDSITDGRIADLRLKEEERRTEALAPQYGYEYIDLHGYTINPEALSAVPEKLARDSFITGFDIIQKTLSVAIKLPSHEPTKEALHKLQEMGYVLKVYMTSQASLDHTWERYKDIKNTQAERKGFFDIGGAEVTAMSARIKDVKDVTVLLNEIKTSNNSRRISETLELIFAGALALGTSDVHIEPEEDAIRLRYRLDGVLYDIVDIDKYLYGRMMSRLKLLSGMILNSKAQAQDGRFTFATSEKEVEVRSSVIPGAYGESIVMRLLDPSAASFRLERLNLNKHVLSVVEQQLKKPNGLIITTGPTGSGKTTALYAFLQQVHTEGTKIITIENPVEYKLEGIVQTQTGDDYTFAAGLRAILRQDPDVILLGEIRDHEVAETALHAAQTGHLVFSTLHTNSAVAGFARLMDLGIDPRTFGTSMNMMMGQRLVRLLCEDCKQPYEPSADDKNIIEVSLATHPHPEDIPPLGQLYRAVGCEACGKSGFKGRQGIFEAIIMDEAVEEVVLRDPREHVILEAAKPQGIPTMIQDGMRFLLEGKISLPELERVVELPRSLSTAIEKTDAVEEKIDDDFLSHVV